MSPLADIYSSLPCLVQSILYATASDMQNLFRVYLFHNQGKFQLRFFDKRVCISLATPTITFEMNCRRSELFAHY
jgi:hypothetical protein